ncbi:MAG: autotransporter-associated beta strand repeat-containing protein [Prevotella sp.]|nr:autotransporter-associated beta strand repeat-containing protein [Prevotella sp.]
MRKKLFLLLSLGMAFAGAWAQRATDVVDRGLVAVKYIGGVYCSWRIPAEEYYDVTYNIYRDGTKINDTPLTVSNYRDDNGTSTSKYTVEAVVRGKAQGQCDPVKPWSNNYLEVRMNHGNLTSTYIPNDACVADVDGDGQMEILLKFDNQSDAAKSYPKGGNNGEYAIIEVYKLDGTKLWWVDLGPNMGDFQNNENNIVAYDWDGDGKAEAVMRAADGTTIHMADGTTQVIGDKSKNYRAATNTGQWFIHEGAEFLLYLNGATGKPYQVMEYPLKRLEDGETNLQAAWGDGYGHRSSKYFFGAPVLDGRKASIFLARGIYTQHKMIAYDVNPATHELTVRWRWNCNTAGSPWYGQGYHNYGIADVDWDGRDEIVFGSMVIDDNGKGLSTTGLGHGDAQHCSDFDPYNHGQEIFACNEDRPGNNFRDATTSKIYYRFSSNDDDGRAIMGNFSNSYPGAQGTSARDGSLISSVSHAAIPGGSKADIAQNMRIYWDGDLCSETFNYVNGKNTNGAIYKPGKGVIATLGGSMTNNDTKGTPCFQGDIFGDWREEVIMRTQSNNIRIYTTDVKTNWRNYSLWHDHQYRQAMVWQMCGYNQPPHTSYFLGEMEGITVAPAPLTMTGRTEIKNGATIGSGEADKHIIMCETGDMTVAVSNGAAPYIFTDNAPTWVQGNDDNNKIVTTEYTHTLTGGAFTGEMRLVKQGDGTLRLPNVTQTYTGETSVWAGTLAFDGTMQSSRVWLNRHSTLVSDGGKFLKGIKADYNATIIPGGKDKKGTIETDSLWLNFGSVVLFDIYGEDVTADVVKAKTLTIEKKDWANGPTYSTPVFRFVKHLAAGADNIANGRYLIGEIAKIEGSISDIKIEGLNSQKATLVHESGKLYVVIENYVAGDVTWVGNVDGVWNVDETPNFVEKGSGVERSFVPGDNVIFDDNAQSETITVQGTVAPKSIVFANETKTLTLNGDSIVGEGTVTKTGAANVNINNVNCVGNTTISAGKITVTSLANEIGQDVGALGTIDKTITVTNNATLGISATSTSGQTVVVGEGGATIDVANGVSLTMSTGIKASASDAVLTKTGSGTLNLGAGNGVSKLIINGGVVNASESGSVVQLPATVEFRSGRLYDPGSDGMPGTSNKTNFVVPEKCTGTLYVDPRCDYSGKLTGAGTFYVYAAGVRNYFKGDWSNFEGTIIPGYSKRGSYDPSFDFSNSRGIGKATLQMNEGIEFKNNGNNVAVANITGKGTLSGTGTYVIGGTGENILFEGSILSPVKKTGDGIWSLSTNSSQKNIGTINIDGGYLYLNTYNSTTVIVGNNPVNVNNGGTINGTGTLGVLNINSGGTITPGRTSTTDVSGFLAAEGNLTANTGSVVNLNIKNANNGTSSRSFLKSGATLTLNGTVNITVSPNYVPAVGDEIILWTANAFAGNPTLNLPALPAGYQWNTADLLKPEGVLRVSGTDGISSIAAGTQVRCRVYTVSGLSVGEFDATAADIKAEARKLGLESGTYIIRVSADKATETVKIVIK